MSVDPAILAALGASLRNLGEDTNGAIPARTIAALAEIAKPGTALTIDLEASAVLGAPLVTLTQQPDWETLFAPLTARQREVAVLIIAGRSNKEIANTLGISLGTTKDHVHAVLHRLGLSSRAAVIAAAGGYQAG